MEGEDASMLLAKNKKIAIFQSKVRLIDPHVSTDDKDSLNILLNIFEPLVVYDKPGEYKPILAERWETSSDARTWVFYLRHPVLFHNGDILKARDVVDSLGRVRNPNLGGELGSQGVYQSYLKGATIEAVDEWTVRIVTPESFADLLDLIALFPIVPSSAMDEIASAPVGSGPYRLVKVESDLIVMKAFRDYWGGRPPVDEINWRAEPKAELRVDALLKGEADIIAGVTAVDARRIEASRKGTISKLESSVCTVFMCNLLSGVCTDRRVRQALNYALDMAALINSLMDGAANPLNGPLTALHFGRDPSLPPYPYSPEKAQELLNKAGYRSGLDLVLDIPTTLPDEAPNLARLMAEQYKRVNIHTEIKEFKDRPKYAEMVRAKQVDDACCFDSSPLSTYRVLREKFHSGFHGPWWQGYTNRQVDALIDSARATVSGEKRQDLYRRAYSMIRDDAPWIFLYNPIDFWGVGPKALKWQPKSNGLIKIL